MAKGVQYLVSQANPSWGGGRQPGSLEAWAVHCSAAALRGL